jgi:glycosyltransferase involved in cell wall biosynthesis
MRALRRAAREGEIRGVVAYTGRGHAPAVVALHGGPAPLLRVKADIRRPARGPLQRWLYRSTDRIVISGDFMRTGFFDGLTTRKAQLLTLPAGLDLTETGRADVSEARRNLRKGHGWPDDAVIVGMLARTSPVKGHRTMVEAARRIAKTMSNIYFLAAGPEGQIPPEEIRSWVRDAGLAERFAVCGKFDGPLEIAAGFDVALILSEGSEAVCRSALEYMALGLPIVATRVNVIPETAGDAAVLIPPRDPSSLVAAVTGMLKDPEGMRRLGHNGVARVHECFDARVIAQRGIEIVERARKERVGSR